MSNLYRVKEEALDDEAFYYIENRNGVEKHGYLWVHEEEENYKSLSTGALWVWYDDELEEVG